MVRSIEAISSLKFYTVRSPERGLLNGAICKRFHAGEDITSCKFLLRQLFYCKVRQVLLQSATGITKCDNFITKCDDCYKVRQYTRCLHPYPNRRTLEYLAKCNKIGSHSGITTPFFMNLQLLIKSNHFDKHNSFKVSTWKGLRL